MIRGLFITGTDTGVGKTVVAAGLLRRLRAEGLDAVPMKPVQTGGTPGPAGLHAPDLETCLRAAHLRADAEEYARMCPYLYEPACSPHLAGRLAGSAPDVGGIVEAAEALAARHDALIVEGAGGVLVPINERDTMLDVMKALALPVVLVARGGLGTINHTLLSVRAVREAHLRLLGVVVIDAAAGERDFVRGDNPAAIEQFGEVKVLCDVPHIPQLDGAEPPEEAWRQLDRHLAGLGEILGSLAP